MKIRSKVQVELVCGSFLQDLYQKNFKLNEKIFLN